jgi:hypothetical protein
VFWKPSKGLFKLLRLASDREIGNDQRLVAQECLCAKLMHSMHRAQAGGRPWRNKGPAAQKNRQKNKNLQYMQCYSSLTRIPLRHFLIAPLNFPQKAAPSLTTI